MKLRIVQTGVDRYVLEQFSPISETWVSFGGHYYINYESAKIAAKDYMENINFKKKVIEEL